MSFKDGDSLESHKQYYLPTVEIKDYDDMIDGRNIFDQPIKNHLKIYDNIRKITTGQGNDCTAECLLDYPYFKRYYKSIATDLSKQPKLDTDSKAIQQINFTVNLDREEGYSFIFFKRNS